jgi:hypothetical protein
MEGGLAAQHYSRPEVEEEVASYAKDRWVAIHCELMHERGRRLLVRYGRGRPLKVEAPSDVGALLASLRRLRPRTFYASSNLYLKLESELDVHHPANVYACTPCWDVDNELQGWRDTLRLCEELVSLLEKEGVSKSVSIFWSGRGAHVRVHHLALSPELRSRIHPFDASYAVVEYVARKLSAIHVGQPTSRGPRVENRMDPQRVFTCPLSLHRELDAVCVCVPLNKLWGFDPSWTSPSAYRHSGEWRRFEEGEADELALKAHEVVGGYPLRPRRARRRRFARLDEAIAKALAEHPP